MGHALRTHPPPRESPPAPRPGSRRVLRVVPPPTFAGLTSSSPARRRTGLGVSLAVHVVGLALLILAPVLWHETLPEHRDYVRALLYAPPPPPPPPPPKGSPYVRETRRSTPPAPAPSRPSRPALTLPADTGRTEAPAPEAASQGLETWGTPTGSETGVPEGMEGGVEGGVVGGVPGGVLGGVIGGTGDVPVPVRDYDRPPRLIRQTKPVYPHEAFTRKVQGTVFVEILIGADGRVRRARVLQSIPALDEAALTAVRQWTFAPAIKQGLPVATLAMAPVSFRIY